MHLAGLERVLKMKLSDLERKELELVQASNLVVGAGRLRDSLDRFDPYSRVGCEV